MNLLTPLGFLALIAFVILALIYFIKPTYKSKVLPSTFIWKESLRYKKNTIHTSKLLNVILIILEILIILTATFILVTPLVSTSALSMSEQNVLIIDGGASMQASIESGESRFDRAIASAKDFSRKSIKKKRPVTVIYAGLDSQFVVKKETDIDTILSGLDSLECSMGKSDIKGAMALANEYISTNALADVYYYTATKYTDSEDVEIVDVSAPNEWNATILDVNANYVDNFYEYEVTIASYGADKYVNVNVEVRGANDEKGTKRATKRVGLLDGEETKVVFKNMDIYAYDSIKVDISMDDMTKDSFAMDDTFILNGGRAQDIGIQYFSTAQNNFFGGILRVLRNSYKDRWDVNIEEPIEIGDIKSKGLDLYIYEHTMPTELPTDGVVLLVNPDVIPNGVDIELGGVIDGEFKLSNGMAHPVTKQVDASLITVSTYRPMVAGEGYETVMKCNGESVFVVNDEKKIAVLSINLNKSNLPILMEFPMLISNIFEYYIPSTIDKNVYEVGEEIHINARGDDVMLKSGEDIESIDVPTTIVGDKCGEYSITQTLPSSKRVTDKFYVRIPKEESDIDRTVNETEDLFHVSRPSNAGADIYVYLGCALLLFICLEKFFYSRENV